MGGLIVRSGIKHLHIQKDFDLQLFIIEHRNIYSCRYVDLVSRSESRKQKGIYMY